MAEDLIQTYTTLAHTLVSASVGKLTFCVPMEFPIKFDTGKSGYSIVYIEGLQVTIPPPSQRNISFYED